MRVLIDECLNFDVFLTGDRNLAFQQNTTKYRIAVLVLEFKGSELCQTMPLMSQVLALLPRLRLGEVVRVCQ